MLQPRPDFPFSAVTGQAPFKTALILAAINPRIGGVLISGPRGCAKSTLARGMADILPGQSWGRPPFATLPLGATEEMLIGTLDLQQVLDDQSVALHPGLLAKAHGGVLYVDEVNLLPDSLVDQLLDVAASGVNCIERDGISHSHPAEFLLIGTMNPDEGELRPQLQDRFGLAVELDNQYPIRERIEIVRRREAFDADPQGFCRDYQAHQRDLVTRIETARQALGTVACAEAISLCIAERCHEARVDGLRADIVWHRAAVAHAAWCGRTSVSLEDVDAVAELVLAHRRNTPPDSRPPTSGPSSGSNAGSQGQPPAPADASNHRASSADQGQWGSMPPQLQAALPAALPDLGPQQAPTGSPVKKSSLIPGGKRRGHGDGGQQASRRMSTTPNWFATLLANRGQWPLQTFRFRKARTGQLRLHLVLLDTSASTLGSRLFGRAKGVVLQLAKQVYLAREQLAILGFGNDRVEQVLPRGRAPKHLNALLDALPGGGGTPIRQALQEAESRLQRWQRQHPGLAVQTYLLTDGRTRQSVSDLKLSGDCLVIDMEQSAVKRGKAKAIAQQLGARYLTLPTLELG